MPSAQQNDDDAREARDVLAWRISQVELSIRDMAARLEQKIDGLHFVPAGVYEADKVTQAERDRAMSQRIDSLKQIVNAIVGVIFTVIVGAVVMAVLRAAGL